MASQDVAACNAALLSAYYDDALPEWQTSDVRLHLRTCGRCQRELDRYAAISRVLNSYPLERQHVSSRPRNRGPEATWRFVALLAVCVVCAVVVRTAVVNLPMLGSSVTVFPPSGAVNVSTTTPIRLLFDQAVNQTVLEQSLQLDPSTPVSLVWDTPRDVELLPGSPLLPGQRYTVTAKVEAVAGHSSSEAMELTTFLTTAADATSASKAGTANMPGSVGLAPHLTANWEPAPASSMPVLAPPAQVALPHGDDKDADLTGITTSLPANESPFAGAASVAGSLGAAHATADPPTVTTASSSTCPVAIATSLRDILHARQSIAASLGCALVTRQSVPTLSQMYERGVLLMSPSDGELYELFADGRWLTVKWGAGIVQPSGSPAGTEASAFDTFRSANPLLAASLGNPLGNQQQATAVFVGFERGRVLSFGGLTYILASQSPWLRFVDPSGDRPLTENDSVDPGATFRTVVGLPHRR